MRFRFFRGALALLTVVYGAVPAIAGDPGKYDGLVAWYRVDSLHRNHNEGELVLEWPDSSGQGRRLVAHADGVRAVFRTRQLNLEPVVEMRANTRFQVEQPFELQDHTVFVVYDTRQTRRALFYDDTEKRRGLVLLDAQQHHRYALEDPKKTVSYSGKPVPRKGFSITVLTRGKGLLGCLVDGVDLSSGIRFDPTIRVGGFFFVQPTGGGRGDADGLRVAEMIFYDRRLDSEEVAEVTAYLSDKYAIEVAASEPPPGSVAPVDSATKRFLPAQESARVWLGTQGFAEVNARAIVMRWHSQVKVEPPFRHDPGDETDSRLVCTQDGTRVELFVQLPLRTSSNNTRVQLLILKNGTEYLDEFGDSGPITGYNPKRARIEFHTTLDLNAGEFIEVVVRGIGKSGSVVIDPHFAALVVNGVNEVP